MRQLVDEAFHINGILVDIQRMPERKYTFPGPKGLAFFFCRLGQIFLTVSIILFIWVPGQTFVLVDSLPLLGGVFITLIAGEVVISYSDKKAKQKLALTIDEDLEVKDEN